MKLGFGIYRHQLERDNLRFARQCGATHVVVHLVDYFKGLSMSGDQPISGGFGGGWGEAGDPNQLWTFEQLRKIRSLIESEGLVWHAIENFDPAHWYDVLLGGPKKEVQLQHLCEMIEAVGAVGVPVIGYNFSLAGVYGRSSGEWARGGARAVGMVGSVDQEPMPDGMIWNMRCKAAGKSSALTTVDAGVLWQRLEDFLAACLPVAERCGVRLAAHPDDPPVPRLRDTPRLVHRPELYDRLLAIRSSDSNSLEFCLGTLAEMPDCDLYELTERYARENKIAYLHCRNVCGTVPDYKEVFIDEGAIDMARIVAILKDCNYDGVLIPDHAPQMSCAAPWHSGMAYTMGYLKALMDSL